MVRAKALRRSADQFEKDGKTIRFQRAYLLPGAAAAVAGPGFVLEVLRPKAPTKKQKKRRAAAAAGVKPEDSPLVDKLRAWRLGIARSRSVPAFHIMTDRVM